MADIFISYSSKDRVQAEQLTELLASAGLSVWIDQSGIDVATSWSGEIVDAIDNCKALVVLLSPSSVESKNVVREVALAFEKNKKILPLDLEPVTLSRDLQYHLAGIQRAPMTNIDAIIRTLGKLGFEATQAPTMKLIKETDSRKSLMILPFEDLSPTADNGWFADGLATELISALSNVKSLKVTDQQTTKEYKKYIGHLTVYAKEMSVRYFIQGSVRKFGDQIKITSSLLDIETGDHLWQDSLKGTMNDIFDIQEQVAKKVVEGLKLHLTTEEQSQLEKHGTENPEAYELYVRADEYFHLNTKEGITNASKLLTDAIALDPEYGHAYEFKATCLASINKYYERNVEQLEEAEALCAKALLLNPTLYAVYSPLCFIYQLQGKLAEAEAIAREFVNKAPQNIQSHSTLGIFYAETGQHAKAIGLYEEACKLKPEYRVNLFNLCIACYNLNDVEKCRSWALVGLPLETRHLKLHPDDEVSRMRCAIFYFYSGDHEAAYTIAQELKKSHDGFTLNNTACLLGLLDKKKEALATIRSAIEAGYRNVGDFLTNDKEGVLSLAGTIEYEEVRQMVEKFQEQAHG